MAQRTVTCHIPIEREIFQVCTCRGCLVTSVTAGVAGWVKMTTRAEKALCVFVGARWGSATLPPPLPRLPHSAFATTLDRAHGLPMTRRCFAGHPDHLTWRHAIVLWGYVKNSVFVTPLPRDLPELRRRIIVAISRIDREMLRRVRTEMDYRLDVYCVTKVRHIEHLWGMQNKLREFLFLSVCRMLPSFAPFRCTIFFVMCQGIEHNNV
jgi:hypothetical protein